MATQTYPYETRLNILCPPLEVIDTKTLADALHLQVVQPDALPGERFGGEDGCY